MTLRSVLGSDSDRQLAGQAAPSTEDCNKSMQVEVESRTRASDTAIEDIDPTNGMDDAGTIADGHVSAGHGTIL